MCLAVYQSPGSTMSTEEMTTAWSNNPDGGGYGFIDSDGKIVVRKFMKMHDMLDMYERDVASCGEHSPFIVHFRLATHGDKNIANCHPFHINDNTIMIHNGILPVYRIRKDMSDSYAFATDYLARMPEGWMDDPFLFDLVNEYVSPSKVVVLTNNESYEHYAYILNEEGGQWNKTKTMWFSNSSHCAIPTYGTSKKLEVYDADAISMFEDGVTNCAYCLEQSVYDDVCYTCEICQTCGDFYDACKCANADIHSMSDHQYYSRYGALNE